MWSSELDKGSSMPVQVVARSPAQLPELVSLLETSQTSPSMGPDEVHAWAPRCRGQLGHTQMVTVWEYTRIHQVGSGPGCFGAGHMSSGAPGQGAGKVPSEKGE